MNSSMAENIHWERLSRYLAGESSDEETREVEAWLKDDPDHYRLLEDLRQLWTAAEIPRAKHQPSAEEMAAERERLLRSIRRVPDENAVPETSGVVSDHAADRSPHRRTARSRSRSRRASPWQRRIAGVVAVMLLLVGGLFALEWTSGPDAPRVKEVVTAKGERATIRLSDSTQVWLSVDTELRVPEAFGDERREVQLDGEAYFEVTPDADRPFVVRSGDARVQVLGTAFGITRYPGDAEVQVVVREGRVSLAPDRPDASAPVAEDGEASGAVLTKDQRGVLPTDSRTVSTETVDAADYLGWVNNRLVFTRTPLPDVARRIERWYDVDVQVDGEGLDERSLTATFEDASLESVAEVVAATLGIQYSVDGDTVTFRRPE